MIVKICDKTYDSKKEPVMIVLSDKDKAIIQNMDPGAMMYACFPKGSTDECIAKWMDERAEL